MHFCNPVINLHSFTDLLMHFTLCVIMYIFVHVLCIHLYFTLISSYLKRSFINALHSFLYLLLFLINEMDIMLSFI